MLSLNGIQLKKAKNYVLRTDIIKTFAKMADFRESNQVVKSMRWA